MFPVPYDSTHTTVEARMERAGIRISPSPTAYLFVSVASGRGPGRPPLRIRGVGGTPANRAPGAGPRYQTFGTTWHKAGLGTAGTSSIPEFPQHMLTALVDHFIAAYREQNTKPSPDIR